jgi:hypothetical protein
MLGGFIFRSRVPWLGRSVERIEATTHGACFLFCLFPWVTPLGQTSERFQTWKKKDSVSVCVSLSCCNTLFSPFYSFFLIVTATPCGEHEEGNSARLIDLYSQQTILGGARLLYTAERPILASALK